MPAAEFSMWRSYWLVCPFGDYRSDVRSGVIASTVANVNRAKNTNPYTPDDFMPFSNKPKVSDEVIIKKIDKFMKRYH